MTEFPAQHGHGSIFQTVERSHPSQGAVKNKKARLVGESSTRAPHPPLTRSAFQHHVENNTTTESRWLGMLRHFCNLHRWCCQVDDPSSRIGDTCADLEIVRREVADQRVRNTTKIFQLALEIHGRQSSSWCLDCWVQHQHPSWIHENTARARNSADFMNYYRRRMQDEECMRCDLNELERHPMCTCWRQHGTSALSSSMVLK